MFRLSMRPKLREWNGQRFRYRTDKLDGHRITIVRGHKGSDNIQVTGKKEDINLWPKLFECPRLRDMILETPAYSALDGELWAEGVAATSVPTLLNAADDRLQFTAFAIPWWSQADYRELELPAVSFLANQCGIPFTKFVEYDQRTVHVINKEALIRVAEELGLEGFVLKTGHYDGWYKVKPTKTIDVVTMSTKEGNGRNAGLLGSIVVGVYWRDVLVKVGTVGGWRDHERLVTDSQVLGRVLEVKFQSITPHGQLQFARPVRNPDDSVRWREDKDPKDCGISQIKELQ